LSSETSGKTRTGEKVIVVMPAYNAEKTVEKSFREIPEGAADDVILVDDASRDDTAGKARSLGIDTFVQPRNMGYGASQKRCYTEALARKADYVVMLHADAQYDASVIPGMIEILRSGEADMVLGSRMKIPGDARRGGMPILKIVVNRSLTVMQNFIFGTGLTDMHTGYRAYTRECLEKLPIERNADGFLFDSQVLAQAAALGLRMKEVPVKSRYFNEASSIGLYHGAIYTAGTLLIVLKYILFKLGIARVKEFEPSKNHDR